MAAGNAWRYPAFYISPEHEHTADFTFSPSHTLFIDASLQVQEDHELIEIGDRTMNEWIMDAVTHQPVGRQAAIKDPDGIFYWDLNAHALRANGAADHSCQHVHIQREPRAECTRGSPAQESFR